MLLATIAVFSEDSLLWNSTVGYPSDSLASCSRSVYNGCQWNGHIWTRGDFSAQVTNLDWVQRGGG